MCVEDMLQQYNSQPEIDAIDEILWPQTQNRITKAQKNAQDEWGRKTSNNNNNDPSHIHLLMIKVLNKPGKCYQAVHIQPLGLVSLSLGSSQTTRTLHGFFPRRWRLELIRIFSSH